jgi:hypothetical protein
MSMRDVIVHCGDVAQPKVDQRASLFLDVEGKEGDEARVNLKMVHITRKMVVDMPDRLADLLEIACYVHCADQFTLRDSQQMPRMGANWRRNFMLRIAVRDPKFWSRRGVLRHLEATLGFLSDDRYSFEFSRTRRSASHQKYLELSGAGPASGFTPAEVILFSGGLDSFAGAAEALLERKVPVVLVSHQSSPLVTSIQTELIDALRQRAGPERLLHVGVGMNKGRQEASEFTQRTRSFLFASLGFVVAHLFGKTGITFFENGIVSLNLPHAQHVLGTRATRTTHPRVLSLFGQLFSLVGERDARVINPYFWMTKGDVVRKIADVGCADLIGRTFSCTRVRTAARLRRRHCGVCSQCIDRRFGVLAADCGAAEASENYAVDLFRGERKPGPETIMAESYVLAAHRHARSTEASFLSAHGEVFRALPFLDLPQWEAATRIHRLHVRHGRAVVDVIGKQFRSDDVIASRLSLPDTCLLAMIQAPATQDIELGDPIDAELPASQQAALVGAPQLQRPIKFAIDQGRSAVCFDEGIALKGAAFRLVTALLPAFLDGLKAQRGIDCFEYMTADRLARSLNIEQHSLRQTVHRLRRALEKQFDQTFRVALSEDDVIENQEWRGYRLNPRLAFASTLTQAADV